VELGTAPAQACVEIHEQSGKEMNSAFELILIVHKNVPLGSLHREKHSWKGKGNRTVEIER
jgi:hypothetical protein